MARHRFPGRTLVPAVAALGVVCLACHSGTAERPGGPPTRPSPAASIAPRPSTAGTPPTSEVGPPATEPPVSAAKLASILVAPLDLPAGFEPAPASETGADLASSDACGHAIVDTTGAAGEVMEALRRPRDHLRLVELVDGFVSDAAAAGPLGALRSLAQSCRQVGPLQPPAVGEEVAGLRIPAPAAVIDVAMVRSGPVVATVLLAGSGSIPAATFQSAVHSVGTKLAVGTGG